MTATKALVWLLVGSTTNLKTAFAAGEASLALNAYPFKVTALYTFPSVTALTKEASDCEKNSNRAIPRKNTPASSENLTTANRNTDDKPDNAKKVALEPSTCVWTKLKVASVVFLYVIPSKRRLNTPSSTSFVQSVPSPINLIFCATAPLSGTQNGLGGGPGGRGLFGQKMTGGRLKLSRHVACWPSVRGTAYPPGPFNSGLPKGTVFTVPSQKSLGKHFVSSRR